MALWRRRENIVALTVCWISGERGGGGDLDPPLMRTVFYRPLPLEFWIMPSLETTPFITARGGDGFEIFQSHQKMDGTYHGGGIHI